MLALLKPWGSLSDLKADGESFEQVFTPFVAGTSQKNLDIIENQVGTLHCTGWSDSQNPYSVPDDPSSRGPVNPRVLYHIQIYLYNRIY
jgi:hypothetical protein